MKRRVRTLVVVLAGGAGGRLELLTHERAKPAVSFAGTHRLIDFPLSNCLNAGLPDVWVVQQFNPISLSDHLANGRPWDLDRTAGGLLILQPRMGHDGREGFTWRAVSGVTNTNPSDPAIATVQRPTTSCSSGARPGVAGGTAWSKKGIGKSRRSSSRASMPLRFRSC